MAFSSLSLAHGYLYAALADSTTTSAGDAATAPLPSTLPLCIADSSDAARPGYSDVTAAEFLDSRAVLAAKVDMLISMWRSAAKPTVYTGAGISTAAGIKDYASRAQGSVVKASDSSNRKELPPTLTHRVLAAMEKRGLIHHWLQQNHDGLAQKAGFPQEKLNEIHGSWFDHHNPVLGMSDSLRPDLLEWMHKTRDEADLVVAMGTSLSGMNADSVCEAVARRHMVDGTGNGLVIIALQKTRLDDVAALRIFAKVDDVMRIIATKLRLKIDSQTYAVPRRPPPKRRAASTTR